MSDLELLTRSLHDPRCFDQLVARHGRRIHAYLCRRTPAHADDLLGEVWLAAFEARGRYDPGQGAVIGWLFGIARNVLLAHYRAEQRRSRPAPAWAGNHFDEWAAVDTRLDAAGVARELRGALADLPPEERDVLLLVAWEELSPTEAAVVLGIPAGTARSRLHRARSRMTTTWAAISQPEDPEREAIS